MESHLRRANRRLAETGHFTITAYYRFLVPRHFGQDARDEQDFPPPEKEDFAYPVNPVHRVRIPSFAGIHFECFIAEKQVARAMLLVAYWLHRLIRAVDNAVVVTGYPRLLGLGAGRERH